jgi:beta-lactamase class A
VIAVDPVGRLEGRAPEVVRLAEEVSLAVMVDPVLLRRARLERVPGATAATEADLWFSPLVRSRGPDGFVFAADAAAALRARLAVEPERLRGARERVAAAHTHLSPALRLEEELIWLSCREDAEAMERCEELLRSAVAALVRDRRAGVANWAARALPAMAGHVRATEAGRMLDAGVSLRLGRGAGLLSEADGTPLPQWLRWVAPPGLPRATLRVRLLAEGVEVDAAPGAGGHAVEVPATDPLLLDVTWPDAGSSSPARRVALRPGEATLVPGDASAGVRLGTLTGELYDLAPRPAPAPPPASEPPAPGGATEEQARAAEGRADPLREVIRTIADRAGARAVAAAYYDYESGTAWSYRGDEWFHAASTVTLPIMVGVFGAIERGELSLNARVHVKNRFLSAAGNGSAFRLATSREPVVHAALGKTMRVHELLHHMVATSSNVATNLLVDLVGIDSITDTLRKLRLDGGLEVRRGVEDDAAFRVGINNRCTADGLVRVLRVIEEQRPFGAAASQAMLQILHDQEYRSGIPSGVPEPGRVANKTGDISTVAHDAGIVYLPGRKPYVLVVLTEWSPQKTLRRRETIARISRAVYQHLAA